MIRSGLVRTKNGYSEGYQSNYNPLNRYEHEERPYVQGPDRPFVPYKSVLDPTTQENTLKRPNYASFYDAVFAKTPTDPVRQIADILVRRLTQNVPGRTLTPSVPGIQPSMGGGGPGAGGPPGGGGGGGFGAGPTQGPAPGPEPAPGAGPGPGPGSAGGPPGPPGGFAMQEVTPSTEGQQRLLNSHFFSPALDQLMQVSPTDDPFSDVHAVSPVDNPFSDSKAVSPVDVPMLIDQVVADFNTGISKNPKLKRDLRVLEAYKKKMEELREAKLFAVKTRMGLHRREQAMGKKDPAVEKVEVKLTKIEQELARALAEVLSTARSVASEANADTQAPVVRRAGGDAANPPPYSLYPTDDNPPGYGVDPFEEPPPAYEAVAGMGSGGPPLFGMSRPVAESPMKKTREAARKKQEQENVDLVHKPTSTGKRRGSDLEQPKKKK